MDEFGILFFSINACWWVKKKRLLQDGCTVATLRGATANHPSVSQEYVMKKMAVKDSFFRGLHQLSY